MRSNSSNQNFKVISIAAIACLLGLNIFQFFSNNKLENTNQQQAVELIEIEKVQTELEKEYYDALSDLEELKSDNVEANSLIEKQKADLKISKNRISRLIKNGKDLDKAKAEIVILKETTSGYLAEINKLKNENQELVSSNQSLSKDKEFLTEAVENEKEVNSQLQEAKAVLVSEKTELSTQNQSLSKKVTLASAVKVDNIVVQGYKLGRSGKWLKRTRAKNVEFIQFCLNLSENKITEEENESFIIRLISPLGETMAIESTGSGVFTNSETEEKTRFTTQSSFEYDNVAKEACTSWQPGISFPKGIYDVEVFNKGYLVGKTTYRLK